jgi:hypothetical protein
MHTGRSFMRFFRSCSTALLLCSASFAHAQNQQQMPRDYRGVQTLVPGIFVTPVPNAPFTATVQILSHETLPDGSINTRTTTAHIARASSGRIYNERRQLVPVTFKGQPALLSAHIFDPATRLNISLNPQTRIAREEILAPAVVARREPTTPPLPILPTPPVPRSPTPPLPKQSQPKPDPDYSGTAEGPIGPRNERGLGHFGPFSPDPIDDQLRAIAQHPPAPTHKQIDLGDQTIDGTTLHGTEKQTIIPAELSTTGQPITITDEYWYSPDLAVYLIIKHNDPRTGEQLVAVTHIGRHEPPPTQFAVPAIYKLVDETPPQ